MLLSSVPRCQITKPVAFGYKGFYFFSVRFVSKMDMWAAVGEGRQKERSLYKYLYAYDEIIVAKEVD